MGAQQPHPLSVSLAPWPVRRQALSAAALHLCLRSRQETQALSELMFYIAKDDVAKCKQVVKRDKIR